MAADLRCSSTGLRRRPGVRHLRQAAGDLVRDLEVLGRGHRAGHPAPAAVLAGARRRRRAPQATHEWLGSVDGDAYYWSSVDPQRPTPATRRKLDAMSDDGAPVRRTVDRAVRPGLRRPPGGRHQGGAPPRRRHAAHASTPPRSPRPPTRWASSRWNEFSENTHVEPSQTYGDTVSSACSPVCSPPAAVTVSPLATDSSEAGAGQGRLTGVLGVGAFLLLVRRHHRGGVGPQRAEDFRAEAGSCSVADTRRWRRTSPSRALDGWCRVGGDGARPGWRRRRPWRPGHHGSHPAHAALPRSPAGASGTGWSWALRVTSRARPTRRASRRSAPALTRAGWTGRQR